MKHMQSVITSYGDLLALFRGPFGILLSIIVILTLISVIFVAGYVFGKLNLREERRDAIKGSKSVTRGYINEELSVLLPGFPGKYSEVRHIGKPVDFVIFTGMDEGRITEIGFVEVKTGKSALSTNERSIRDIVLDAQKKGARMNWYVYRPDNRKV